MASRIILILAIFPILLIGTAKAQTCDYCNVTPIPTISIWDTATPAPTPTSTITPTHTATPDWDATVYYLETQYPPPNTSTPNIYLQQTIEAISSSITATYVFYTPTPAPPTATRDWSNYDAWVTPHVTLAPTSTPGNTPTPYNWIDLEITPMTFATATPITITAPDWSYWDATPIPWATSTPYPTPPLPSAPLADWKVQAVIEFFVNRTMGYDQYGVVTLTPASAWDIWQEIAQGTPTPMYITTATPISPPDFDSLMTPFPTATPVPIQAPDWSMFTATPRTYATSTPIATPTPPGAGLPSVDTIVQLYLSATPAKIILWYTPTPAIIATSTPVSPPDFNSLIITPQTYHTSTPLPTLTPMPGYYIPTPIATTYSITPMEIYVTPWITSPTWITPTTPTPVAMGEFDLTLTQIVSDATGLIADIDQLAIDVEASNALPTNQFGLYTAPASFIPDMPRLVADAGYTILLLGDDLRTNGFSSFSLTAWSNLFGFILAIPFSFAKSMYAFGASLGFFGMFFYWIFFITPFILSNRVLIFFIQAGRWLFAKFVSIMFFVFEIIKILLLLIEALDNIFIIGTIMALIGGLCVICAI